MKKVIGYGNPVNLAIMADSIDAVFIDNEDKKLLIYWLRGGQVQKIFFPDEETCRKDFESVIGILSKE